MLGLVYKVDEKIFLSFYETKDVSITSGIRISGIGFEELKDTEIVIVDVEFRDGTEPIEIENPHEYVDNINSCEPYCIFYNIRHLLLGTCTKTIKDITKDRQFGELSKELYNSYMESIK